MHAQLMARDGQGDTDSVIHVHLSISDLTNNNQGYESNDCKYVLLSIHFSQTFLLRSILDCKNEN